MIANKHELSAGVALMVHLLIGRPAEGPSSRAANGDRRLDGETAMGMTGRVGRAGRRSTGWAETD
jgi:hypothetical protein